MKTHSSKGVGDSQPYGGDQRRNVSESQEYKHRQSEDGRGQTENAPQTHVILKQTGVKMGLLPLYCFTETDLCSYYDNACNSHEDQRNGINSSSNIGCLRLTVAAVLILNELTGQETENSVVLGYMTSGINTHVHV